MLLGVDQVLLDLVVDVTDEADTFFDRYGLERNSQCLAEVKHDALIVDVVARAGKKKCEDGKAPVVSLPGGVAANSLRGASWWFRTQADEVVEAKSAADKPPVPALKMFGMVGHDDTAARLRQEMTAAGVDPIFQELPEGQPGSDRPLASHTGVCCCFIVNRERTMITELGAARTMELHGKLAPLWPGWTDKVTPVMAAVDEAWGGPAPCIVVMTGFYVNTDPEGAKAILQWCSSARAAAERRPLLAIGVGARWTCRLPCLHAIAKTADFVFANEPEVLELARAIDEAQGEQLAAEDSTGPVDPAAAATAFETAVRKVSAWKTQGWIVATCGSKSVRFGQAGAADAVSVPVPALPPEKFVDDVGAGDSFMGGFVACAWSRLHARLVEAGSPAEAAAEPPRKRLKEAAAAAAQDPAAALLQSCDVEAAVRAGIQTAAASLQGAGCQFPA